MDAVSAIGIAVGFKPAGTLPGIGRQPAKPMRKLDREPGKKYANIVVPVGSKIWQRRRRLRTASPGSCKKQPSRD